MPVENSEIKTSLTVAKHFTMKSDTEINSQELTRIIVKNK